jgi:hypothetical protein
VIEGVEARTEAGICFCRFYKSLELCYSARRITSQLKVGCTVRIR